MKPSNVIDLVAKKEENQPHSAGTAKCLDCKHEWEAVAPTATEYLECPNCLLMLGRFKFTYLYTDQYHWTCKCGNDLFHITKTGVYCPNCGDWTTGFLA